MHIHVCIFETYISAFIYAFVFTSQLVDGVGWYVRRYMDKNIGRSVIWHFIHRTMRRVTPKEYAAKSLDIVDFMLKSMNANAKRGNEIK